MLDRLVLSELEVCVDGEFTADSRVMTEVTLPYKKMKPQKFPKGWRNMDLYASLTLYTMDLVVSGAGLVLGTDSLLGLIY